MTKVMIPIFGWIYLHAGMEWGTGKLLSGHLSCAEIKLLFFSKHQETRFSWLTN